MGPVARHFLRRQFDRQRYASLAGACFDVFRDTLGGEYGARNIARMLCGWAELDFYGAGSSSHEKGGWLDCLRLDDRKTWCPGRSARQSCACCGGGFTSRNEVEFRAAAGFVLSYLLCLLVFACPSATAKATIGRKASILAALENGRQTPKTLAKLRCFPCRLFPLGVSISSLRKMLLEPFWGHRSLSGMKDIYKGLGRLQEGQDRQLITKRSKTLSLATRDSRGSPCRRMSKRL